MSRGFAVVLLGALTLAACGPFPDARNRAHERAVLRAAEQARPVPPPGGRLASPAENACLNAAVAEGYRVIGVAGTTEVAGADGRPVAQRVVVKVARGDGPTMAWPCTYHLNSGAVAS